MKKRFWSDIQKLSDLYSESSQRWRYVRTWCTSWSDTSPLVLDKWVLPPSTIQCTSTQKCV